VSVRCDPDPVVGGVPGDRVGDLPAAELAECFPLMGVVLADVLGQDVDDPVVAVEQRPQRTAGTDRAELAVIPDQDHLGLGEIAGGHEAEHVAVVGHPGLVQHDHMARGELQGAVVQAPQQGRHRPALQAGFPAEGAGSLP
jgi:hypothetical protein